MQQTNIIATCRSMTAFIGFRMVQKLEIYIIPIVDWVIVNNVDVKKLEALLQSTMLRNLASFLTMLRSLLQTPELIG